MTIEHGVFDVLVTRDYMLRSQSYRIDSASFRKSLFWNDLRNSLKWRATVIKFKNNT